jgi:AcrR family transcriptional regulator
MNPKIEQLLPQVLNLYQLYGIKSVTMDDVAANLGISKKTLYEHFTDKADLVQQVLMMENDRHGCFVADIEKLNLNAVEELFEVYKMIRSIFNDFNPSMEFDVRKYYPDIFIKIRDIRRRNMYESVFRNLEKGKQEGFYRADLNADLLARLHVSRIENLFHNDMFSKEELTSFTLFHEVFVYHIHGILSQTGRAFFDANFTRFLNQDG